MRGVFCVPMPRQPSLPRHVSHPSHSKLLLIIGSCFIARHPARPLHGAGSLALHDSACPHGTCLGQPPQAILQETGAVSLLDALLALTGAYHNLLRQWNEA